MLSTGFWSKLSKTGSSTATTERKPSGKSVSRYSNLLSPKEKYDHLTEYGTQMLCLLSSEYGCGYLSKNFDRLTGHSSDSKMGPDFFQLVHEDFRERLEGLLAQDNASRSPQPLRCKLQHADGKWYWYMMQVHPRNQSGENVCILDNIHEHMQTQNTLHKARLEAELALRARSEFLANMSHELRTPLNAVIGFSQIIESEMFGKLTNPQYLDYIKHIQESGYDLLSRIEDLLEIANIDAGRVMLDREKVMVSDIINHVLQAQTHHAFTAHVELKAPPLKEDLCLNVDRLKLQHILGHLVANSIRHCEAGGQIILDVALTYEGDIRLRVSDTGVGMTDLKLRNLMAALEEDNCWFAKNNRSIGLGLALTKEFVSLHGGQVQFSSKSGAGTTVDILLPKTCLLSTAIQSRDHLQAAG